ncbi:MAG: hypothetical protein AAGD11_07800 [Planctomycetota bacterium]
MLTLFLLIGTAFIVSSNQYRQANKARARATETSNASIDQQDLLNEVINQLVRDTNNPNSTLRFHSLLRDMYGNDGMVGEVLWLPNNWSSETAFLRLLAKFAAAINSNSPGELRGITDGQIVEVAVYNSASVTDQERPQDYYGNPIALSSLGNYYNGRVLTFTSGPARGQSARILGYRFDSSSEAIDLIQKATDTTGIPGIGIFRLMAFPTADGQQLTPVSRDDSPIRSPEIIELADVGSGANLGPSFVINGRPFNGTGAGFNRLATAGARLTGREVVRTNDSSMTQSLLLALLPNATTMLDFNDYDPEFYMTDEEIDFANSLTAEERQTLQRTWFALRGPTGLGGADESYDAVDFQNMALALLQTSPVETLLTGAPGSWPSTPTDWPSLDGLGGTVVPSFHRPALLNFARAGATIPLHLDPHALRKIMLRPSWLDHRNFTGSNPEWANIVSNFSNELTDVLNTGGDPLSDPEVDQFSSQLLQRSVFGPWDVDNDLDGVRDSVWIDAGLPVIENHDGRLVKPLVSLLVLDMDGRLNLNAHGSEDIASSAGVSINATLADGTSSDALPHGSGYGPAEISLDPLMPATTPATKWSWYTRMFEGVETGEHPNAIDARIEDGSDALTPQTIRDVLNSMRFNRRTVGRYGSRPAPLNNQGTGRSRPLPGVDDVTVFDIAGQLKMQGVPRWATGNIQDTSILGGYVSPPDFRGRYGVGLDALGRPVYEALATSEINSFDSTMDTNTPYEMDLSLGASRGDSLAAPDGPYTMAELERILRPYDADAGSLPSRIWDFADGFKTNPNDTLPNLNALNLWRTTVTTDSYDLPVPSVSVPQWMVLGPDGQPGVAGNDDDGINGIDDLGEIGSPNSDDFQGLMGRPPVGLSFSDLLEYRIRLAYFQNPSGSLPPLTALILQREMQKLMPPDLANGLRLDLNRPLGNGRDDNNNRVVDEPGEWDDLSDNSDGNTDVYDGELEAPFWISGDAQIQNSGFTGNSGRFRDERILLEDRDNDGDVDNDDRLRIGIAGDMSDPTVEVVNTYEELVSVHNMRRQLLARDLYIMALTLADPLPAAASAADQRVRARRMAQWAINVVDFRDPDNIMTAFEYDANPFDGWTVDGSLAVPNNDVAGTDGNLGTSDDVGGIVWGAEAQELVMTETMAWHDRRTEDTQSESMFHDPAGKPAFTYAMKDADADYDQMLRPRGACFVELYCPLPTNPAANADTHLIQSGQDLGVNLQAVDRITGDSPVWRMCAFPRPANLRSIYCADWDPDSPIDDERPTDLNGNPMNPDRTVYFARFDENDAMQMTALKNLDASDGVEFFTTLNVPSVRPGRFMVVGSGEEQNGTGSKLLDQPLNQRVYGANIGDMLKKTGDNQRRIELRPNDLRNPLRFVEPSSSGGAPRQVVRDAVVDPDDDTRAICDVAVLTHCLSEASPTSLKRRFTISEPARGYPGDDPTNFPPAGPTYRDSKPNEEGFYGSLTGAREPYDIPHDDNRQDGETRLSFGPEGSNFQLDDPFVVECFSVLCLQRLANPMLPFDKDTNPYRTIDSMSANVSVFNGRIRDPNELGIEFYQPVLNDGGKATRIEYRTESAATHFASLQRGFALNQIQRSPDAVADNPYSANVLAYEPPSLAAQRPLPQSPPQLLSYNRIINRRKTRTDIGMQSVPINQYSGTLPFDLDLAPVLKTGYAKFTPTETEKNALNVLPDMTLGRLNQGFMSVTDQNLLMQRQSSIVNDATSTAPADRRKFVQPEEPFPWLTWHNRPFANSDELLLVPRSSSSNLLKEFSGSVNTKTDNSLVDAYVQADILMPTSPPSNPAALPPGQDTELGTGPRYLAQRQQGRFGHLPNMQLSEVPQNTKPSDVPSGLHRILEYVHVASPFVGSETWLNPLAFDNFYELSDGTVVPLTNTNDPRFQLQPPFNKVSAYREPGRVNVNTVMSADVWEGGVLHHELIDPSKSYGEPLDFDFSSIFTQEQTQSVAFPPFGINLYVESWPRNHFAVEGTANPRIYGHSGPDAFELTDSRRGYGNAMSSGLLLNDNSPTFFENPFRSADAATYVPLGSMTEDDAGRARRTSEVTMLRPDELETTTTRPTVFAADTTDDAGTTGVVENAFRDSNRNAAFRYQPITRLSSMTTNRSNVYAVWVTIGFFEVQEAPSLDEFRALNDPMDNLSPAVQQALYDRVYPDGYQFGQEAGSDTGDIRRVREFAMIDRTIPVAFEPGENHNIDKAIRLRRRIE